MNPGEAFGAAVGTLLEQAAQRGPLSLEGENEVVCSKCDGHLTFTGTAPEPCPFCLTSLGGADVCAAPDRLAVDAVLPFALDAAAVEEAAERWIQKRKGAPKAFKKMRDLGSLVSVYASYFTFDVGVQTHYIGQRGMEQTSPMSASDDSITSTFMQWEPASGIVFNTFENVMVLANTGFDDDHVHELEAWPTDETVGQGVPELLPAIKAEVDRDRSAGRFILTGSTRLLSIAEVSESLPGRVEIVDLGPLSQGEIERCPEGFVDALFGWDTSLMVGSNLKKADYFERLCAGGFPEPLARSGRRRQAWFSSYATTVVERMVADLAEVQRLAVMPQLLRLCAARTSGVLNTRNLADDLGIPYRTVGSYLAHLRAVFLVALLPAWSRNLTSKVAHRPKIHLADSGLAAHLVGMDPSALVESAAPGGALLETFVVAEVTKQLGWSATDAAAYHFRDRGGIEVDLVLEVRNGAVAGVEVKASSTVRSRDFRGLRLLAERLGDQFVGGVVLYTGPDPVPFGDRLLALPRSALWQVSA